MDDCSSERNWRACPRCGSEFFLSTRLQNRAVFKITEGYSLRSAEQSADDTLLIEVNSEKFFCGACSWSGSISEVVDSHM